MQISPITDKFTLRFANIFTSISFFDFGAENNNSTISSNYGAPMLFTGKSEGAEIDNSIPVLFSNVQKVSIILNTEYELKYANDYNRFIN